MIIAMDFGVKLALHDASGPRPLPKRPRVKGGASIMDKFAFVLQDALSIDDVVYESPTTGSSGAEQDVVKQIVDASPHDLYLLTSRAVKNYRMDHGIDFSEKSNENDVRILYDIASTQPTRMKLWQFQTERFHRENTCVRPWDKRKYRGSVPDFYMSKLPSFDLLPSELQRSLGNEEGNDYNRSIAMPLAMALEEEGADTRDGYERIIGLYEHGYGSFYRRATISLMKKNAGVGYRDTVSKEIRKPAWNVTRKQIRQLHHMIFQK